MHPTLRCDVCEQVLRPEMCQVCHGTGEDGAKDRAKDDRDGTRCDYCEGSGEWLACPDNYDHAHQVAYLAASDHSTVDEEDQY